MARRSPTAPIAPVAIHAKVNRERASVVEVEKLVLAAALHALNAATLQLAQPQRSDSLRERRVQQPQPRDDFAFRGARELLCAPLRLREARACMKSYRAPASRTTPLRHCRASVRQGHPSAVRTHREPAVRNTLILILVLNALVAAVKIVVGIRTNALSVLGASLESALDVLNNIVGIALVAGGVAGARRGPSVRPPEVRDARRARHRRLPLHLVLRAAARRRAASDRAASIRTSPSLTELSLIAATMFVNVAVVWFERRRARQLNSDFLLADAAHTRSDIYVTAAAFASLVLARSGLRRRGRVARHRRGAAHRVERISDREAHGAGARR